MKTIFYDYSSIAPWVCARTGGSYDGIGSAIGVEDGGKIIGGVLYDGFNGRSICMHVAGDGQWMTRELLRIAFDYPFNQLRVNAIIGLVDSLNVRARLFDEKLGFKLRCVIPDAGPNGDLCIYSMMRTECRWLQLEKRQHGR